MQGKTARDLMNPNVITVRDDLTSAELASILNSNDISGAPVVNRDGLLVGTVSLADVGRAASEEGGLSSEHHDPDFYLKDWDESFNAEDLEMMHIEVSGMRVRDFMSSTSYTVTEETPVEEVARREGDPAELVAGNARALQLLGWQPRHNDLAFILRTAWEWEKKLTQRLAPPRAKR